MSKNIKDFLQFMEIKVQANLSLENLINFNKACQNLVQQQNLAIEDEFFREIEKVQEKDIKAIKEDCFVWTTKRAKELLELMRKLGFLQNPFFLEFGNSNFLR